MGTNEELWYCTPAGGWDEALPVGNGRIGAMIYGDPEHEIMQLNEDSIWYGGPMDRINPDALPNLEKVRRLILDQLHSGGGGTAEICFFRHSSKYETLSAAGKASS